MFEIETRIQHSLSFFLHFAMSCVVVLIGNDDEEEDAHDDDEEDEDGDEDEDADLERREGKVNLACACARRLWHLLNRTRMFSGHPVCADPILLPNKGKEKIREGIREAVRLVKDKDAAWLIIYYAGHAFWDELYKEVVIEPKARRHGMKLEKHVKLTVHQAELEFIKTTIFVDSCLVKKKAKNEAEDDYQLRDSKNSLGNTFLLVKSCELGESVRDGCLFARAIERCARVHLDQRSLKEHVEELAWQLSFGRLCPTSKCIAEVNYMVLNEKQRRRGLFENTHFLRFALDLWTEDKLEPEDSDIDETLQILRRIATEFERKPAAFEESWHELEAIGHSSSLEDFQKYLQRLETPVRDDSGRPMPVLIPENVRRAIVEVLQEKIRDPKFQQESETNFGDLRYLVQDIGKWYKRWEGQKPKIPPEDGYPETGTCNFLLDEEVKDLDVEGPLQQWPGLAYSLVVEDLDVNHLEESERKKVAEEINQLCEDFGIPGRVYLVPGSLWIVFCVNVELSRHCRKKLAASLKSWIDQQKKSGANGWTLARDPCWKPLHAVPDWILDLVRQVETLCATCLPTKPMWLRASDLRNLVAEAMKERQLEEWRVVVFEGLVERRGDSWLQGTGTLGCCFLPHFDDERLDHRMQEVANLACKRKQSMRPELQALVFLLQRAQLELTDEEWTQVVDNARVCYERLKTVLRKVMLVDDSGWAFVDSGSVEDGSVEDYENPSGRTGRDAATAAAAASNSSGSFEVLRSCDVVSKCVVCCISAYDKLKPLKGGAIDFQHAVEAVEDLECEAVTTYLTDHVKCSELKKAFDQVITFFETSEDLPDLPVFLALVSCNAIPTGSLPHLLGSDAPADESAWSLGVDVEEFANKLGALKFRTKNVKKLRAILVFDCCHAGLPVLESRRQRNLLMQLRNDAYIIFSCEKGHTSSELEQRGGALMRELLPSLKYQKNIIDIFRDACSRVKFKSPVTMCYVPKAYDIPVLGRKLGDPPGWMVGMKHDFGDDRAKKNPKKVMDMSYMSDSEAPQAAEVRGGPSSSAESARQAQTRPVAKAQASLTGLVFGVLREVGNRMAQVFMRGWNSGLNDIADQQAWSPSSVEGGSSYLWVKEV